MSTFVLVFILIIIFIILVVCSTYATDASVKLKDFKDDDNISAAYKYVTWAVTIIWITLAGMIIGLIALIFFGPELIPTFGKTIVYLAIGVMFIAIVAIAVICAISTYYLRQSNNTVDVKLTAEKDMEIALGISIATIVFAGIAYWYANRMPKYDSDMYGVPPPVPYGASGRPPYGPPPPFGVPPGQPPFVPPGAPQYGAPPVQVPFGVPPGVPPFGVPPVQAPYGVPPGPPQFVPPGQPPFGVPPGQPPTNPYATAPPRGPVNPQLNPFQIGAMSYQATSRGAIATV